MSNKIQIRYQKRDQFNNPVFIASKEREPESFAQLVKYQTSLKKKFDTFLPVFANTEKHYATIRFQKQTLHSLSKPLKPNDTYSIKFDIKAKTKDNKKYCNCFLRKIKFVKAAPPVDEGSDVELD